jgi:diguanylate cyclase (GGDEF)-like protein
LSLNFEPNSILATGGLLSLMMGIMLFVQAIHLPAFRASLGAMCVCLLCGAIAIFLAVDSRGATIVEYKLAANIFGSLSYVSALVSFAELYKPLNHPNPDRSKHYFAFFAVAVLVAGAPIFTDLKQSYIFNQSIRIAAMAYATYFIAVARDPNARALRWFALALAAFSTIGMLPQLAFVMSHTSEQVAQHISDGNNASLEQAIVWAVSPSIAYTCVTSVIFARISKKLRNSAYIDMLTGAHSRRYLIEKGNKVVEEKRARLPLGATSILMIDIDHFKKINDNWGHIVGDAVLKHCVDCMMKAIRADDAIVGRYGGEEFCVVLPNTPMAGADVVAERLRSQVAATPYIHGNESISITISIGIALQNSTTSFSHLVSIADQRLYRAKEAGRNQVISWGDKSTLSEQASM